MRRMFGVGLDCRMEFMVTSKDDVGLGWRDDLVLTRDGRRCVMFGM